MGKIVTLKDIAKELNVSITTVSKAINNHPDISKKRKKEILDYVKKMNYTPNQVAQSFRKKATHMIGIILSDNSNPFYARMLRGIEETMTANGYQSIIINTHEDVKTELQMIDQLRGLNVAGVILMPASGNKRSVEVLKAYNIPYVLVCRYLEEKKDNYIVLDDYLAAYKATQYLCSYGNERLFFLNFLSGVSSAQERLRGYNQAMKDNGIEYDPKWVVSECINQADGYNAMKGLLEKYPLPMSVLCYSDYIAIGAVCAIQEQGLNLPHDVALVGNDDIDILSYMKPRLTTIGSPKLRMGILSAESLLTLIQSKTEKDDAVESTQQDEDEKYVQHILKPSLIIRETA